MVLWPSAANAQYLIACNEEGTAQPGLQRINIATGAAATIVTGTTVCDPVRQTPWGTILFGEENGGGPTGGRMYELVDPVGTTGVTLDRTTGLFTGGTGATNLTARPALGRLSFEGLGILPNGVTYYGDENRPSAGTAGGAYFKFVPTSLYTRPTVRSRTSQTPRTHPVRSSASGWGSEAGTRTTAKAPSSVSAPGSRSRPQPTRICAHSPPHST
jgi:secreted PhoX family phosphatase